MTRTTRTQPEFSSPGAVQQPDRRRELGALDVLILSIWCGLAAGLLEVAARVLCKYTAATRLYTMSRHFVWLVPLANLLLFVGIGVFLALAIKCCPRRGAWFGSRFLCSLTLLPALMVAGPQIYTAAWLILLMGVASLLVPTLERHAIAVRWTLFKTIPCLLGLVLVAAGFTVGGDWLKQRRESGQPLPYSGAPNILLIVLDTVRADHMSLYGYTRATTPSLERLAKQGIVFDHARATAPWTLPSHASMFTGRWPHELGVKWLAPLPGNAPTLAEFLGSQGYATAGFVANTLYCSYATGLDRGFTHYEDYDLERLGALRTSRLIDYTLKTLSETVQSLKDHIDAGPFRPLEQYLLDQLVIPDKKHAESISREFLDWLAHRSEPNRPFFAFLNYYDAHTRYLLPRGAEYRFGLSPWTLADRQMFEHWLEIDKLKLPAHYRTLITDCYDNCLAYLDQRLGELFDELERRDILDRTIVIVTSDHGEGLGEHDLFDHGESLYRTELRVPLLVFTHEGGRYQGVVPETVSLRDLPATITDLIGLAPNIPFPGRSLARLWQDPRPVASPDADEGALSELAERNPGNPNQGRSPAARGPLVSLAVGNFVYIRNEGDGSEQLFNEHDDPRELDNRAHVDAMKPVVKRLRARLEQMKAGDSNVTK